MQGENIEKSKAKTHGISRTFLVTLIVLIIVAGVFVWYYVAASGQISRANSLISTLSSEKQSLQAELSSASSEISTLESQVSSLETQLSSTNAQISSLQSQLSSGGSEIANLQAQISSLQSQNSNLQSIVNLSQSSTQASSVTVNQAAGQLSLVKSFSASYAGYIVVSGTSTTTNGYIMVTDSFSGYPYNSTTYSFGTGATRIIPLLPGTVSVYFGNTNFSSGATATITVTYYY